MTITSFPPVLPDKAPGDGNTLTVQASALGISDQLLSEFLSVRDQQSELLKRLDRMARRVVLPRCREIGAALDRIQDFYPKGKKGPNGAPSDFYRHAEIFTKLHKRQIQKYLRVYRQWDRLMEAMEDLPPGRLVFTLTDADELLTELSGSGRRPALSGAVDVDAKVVAATAGTSARRTSYASSTRKRAMPALESLLNTEVGQRHAERIHKVIEAVELLLRTLEEEEEEAAPAEEWSDAEPVVAAEEIAPVQPRSWAHPQATPVPAAATSLEAKGARLASFFGGEVISLEVAAATPAPAPVEEPTAERRELLAALVDSFSETFEPAAEDPAAVPAPAAPLEGPAPAEGQVSLTSLFPLSTPGESFEVMCALVVQEGSGAKAAASLGCALSSFKNHKSKLGKLAKQEQEQGKS